MCVISEAQSQSHFFLTPTNDKIHLSVLNFEKQERQKEVAELEQTISGSKEELFSILHQQIAAGYQLMPSSSQIKSMEIIVLKEILINILHAKIQ